MTSTTASPSHSWEQEGQRLSPLLDNTFAAVIAGFDAHAAAMVAVGVARAQGARRRVAIADLIGESAPLEALNRSDDPHGVSDSFLYGVSLNKIARQVDDMGNVFLMPSGTEAVAHHSVYANDRWRRLAAGFHEVGALLLIVAIPGTPGFADLCGFVGSLLPVGDARFPMPPGVAIIAPPPDAAPPPPPAPQREKAARARQAAADLSGVRRRKLIAAAVAIGAVAVAVGAMWPQIISILPPQVAAMLTRGKPDTSTMLVKPTAMDTARTGDSALLAAAKRVSDSLAAVAADSALRVVVPPLVVANPADSVAASRYAIFYAQSNTVPDIVGDVKLKAQRAVAASSVVQDGATWYRVYVGASADKDSADAQLNQFRAAKIVGDGSVAIVPYALRLEGGVGATTAHTRVVAYGRRGIVAYALLQPNGTATLYTGAFETPSQATTMADSLRALGITPVLAYRTGRAF